jgi:hypothetical protein
MARSYHKGWQSDRPLKRDSRRVKWYQGMIGDMLSIRLNFSDEIGAVNLFYSDKDLAQNDYERFIRGEVEVIDLMDAKDSA